ncbi:MAG TPA: saccharopine dehydrogenase NADP-binding domain-containing protein, partial [Clostridia bacterium]
MGKALIIGAGGVANVVIRKCCQNPGVFEEILIASRTLAKCDAIRDAVVSWTKTRVRTARLDADDSAQTAALIREFQPDIVIN